MNQLLLETAIIMLVGFIGCVAPLLPGPPIVWLGALYYGWKTDFADYGWPTLLLMLLFALIGSTAEYWLSYFGARKGGASVWSSLAALVGGLIGLLVFSLPGLVIGSFAAIALVEWNQHKDWNKVLKAGTGYLVGYLLSMVVEIVTCIAIVIVFVLAIRF
ncbi:MAG TPA: DUF456 domain-containing protein [Abditibacteriaceae bacterium]|jgi:hypothetical protein